MEERLEWGVRGLIFAANWLAYSHVTRFGFKISETFEYP